MSQLAVRRREIDDELRQLTDLEFWNAGGSGSVQATAADPVVTEIAAGSGLLVPTLFDHYRSFEPRPASYLGLPVVRRPGPGMVTVHGGGIVASGPAGADRLPTPWAPAGLELTGLEGAGEVQTPIVGQPADLLEIGDLVWFRPAKSGEPFEHAVERAPAVGQRVRRHGAELPGLWPGLLTRPARPRPAPGPARGVGGGRLLCIDGPSGSGQDDARRGGRRAGAATPGHPHGRPLRGLGRAAHRRRPARRAAAPDRRGTPGALPALRLAPRRVRRDRDRGARSPAGPRGRRVRVARRGRPGHRAGLGRGRHATSGCGAGWSATARRSRRTGRRGRSPSRSTSPGTAPVAAPTWSSRPRSRRRRTGRALHQLRGRAVPALFRDTRSTRVSPGDQAQRRVCCSAIARSWRTAVLARAPSEPWMPMAATVVPSARSRVTQGAPGGRCTPTSCAQANSRRR